MSIKLVIVDDAPFIRDVLRHIFVNSTVEVVGEAADGVEALKVVRETKPDVILMDIVMPKKSGIEATADILKEFPETRVIACSTVDQDSMVMRALEAGCCNFITKPFTAEGVLHAVQSAVKRKDSSVDEPSI